ncbi:MAG: nitroreductase/quinone reductase family protein [Thermomicrobiales bacterium]
MNSVQPNVVLPRWLKPMNRVFVALQRRGLSLGGMHVLTVIGRRSGKPRTTPISVMTWNGERYIVGGFPGADWVANARVAGTGTLASGKRKELVRLVELPTDEAGPVLRAFPTEVPSGVPMMAKAGVVNLGTPEEFEALAGHCAVFRVELA